MSSVRTNKTKSENAPHRKLELPKRQWYDPRTWRRNLPLPPRKKISSTIKLLRQTFVMIRKGWRTIGGITLVYAIGVLVFVRSFSVGSTDATNTVTSGVTSKASETISNLTALLSQGSSSVSAASGVYQVIISTICSLAFIWAFRQILSREKAGVKESFYQGMTPLVKYLLVLAMIGVQLIPLAIGSYIFTIVYGSGLFFGWEVWAAGSVFALSALWSLRLITHSFFALFITTLPDMTPLRSLRSAKKMVYRRRLLIWRKFLGAIVFFAIVVAVIMLPFVLWWAAVAPWILFVLSVLILPLVQAYAYTIYREIL